MTTPPFDLAQAHKYFAVSFFNETWSLIEKKERSLHDDQLMVALSQASLCHWMMRPDCSDQNLSIAFWQLSRVYALIGQAGEARRLGEICLGYSGKLEPFYRGFAHEALARATALQGNGAAREVHLAEARRLAAEVADAGERESLEADLATVPEA